MIRSYALRGDIVLVTSGGRGVSVPAAQWANLERRWINGLDAFCQPVMVDRATATRTGTLA